MRKKGVALAVGAIALIGLSWGIYVLTGSFGDDVGEVGWSPLYTSRTREALGPITSVAVQAGMISAACAPTEQSTCPQYVSCDYSTCDNTCDTCDGTCGEFTCNCTVTLDCVTSDCAPTIGGTCLTCEGNTCESTCFDTCESTCGCVTYDETCDGYTCEGTCDRTCEDTCHDTCDGYTCEATC